MADTFKEFLGENKQEAQDFQKKADPLIDFMEDILPGFEMASEEDSKMVRHFKAASKAYDDIQKGIINFKKALLKY